MAPDRDLRTTFNDVAEVYDEVRPGYPEQLIEDAVLLSGVPSEGRLLEIGCGSGQATLPFAQRGYTMLCLELGANLARLAAERCLPYPKVEVQNVSFEEWPIQEEHFDLVTCAEAIGWISPAVRWSKTAAALKREGAIALFWNDHRGGESGFFQHVEEVYRERAPHLIQERSRPPEGSEEEMVDEIENSGLFGDVIVRRYPWREEYTAERYVKLISTYSPIQSLAKDVRQNVLKDVRELIERYGGVLESEYLSRLYVARVNK